VTFAALADGSALFIDSNIFVYHFVAASPQCTELLARCANKELTGSTSVLVLAEVCHRMMMTEAVERKLVSPGNVPRKLASRPDLVRQLNHEAAVEAIPRMAIEVMPLTDSTMKQGLRLQRRYGLLTNDSLIVATMLDSGLRILATADRRLAGVSEIEIVVPTDLNIAS